MRSSSPDLRFAQHDRLLVVAPHPDDETLACGELIQSALAEGAAVRVVFATDGDNNPWPQRWLEKRWHIGAKERQRWGERRRGEAARALAVLGAGTIETRFLGRPDQGLTDELMQGDALVEALASEIAVFAPTHLALPSLDDNHPDHSALHIAIQLALLRARHACAQLAYAIHGADEAGSISSPRFQAKKSAAMACYASQLALSSGRMLAIARKPECFVATTIAAADAARDDSAHLRIAVDALPAWRAAHDVLVVVATREATLRATARLPLRAKPGDELPAHAGDALRIVFEGDALDVTLPASSAPPIAAWAKLHRAGARIVVFDRSRWHALGESAARALPSRLRVADQTR